MIKIKVLVDQLAQTNELTHRKFLMEINQNDSEFSIMVLAYLSDPLSNQSFDLDELYNLLLEKIIDHPDSLIKILKEEALGNKDMLIDLAVEIQPSGVVSALVNLYKACSSANCRTNSLKAMVEIGSSEAINAMIALVDFKDSQGWIPIVTSIGAVENQGAVNGLSQIMGHHEELDRTILQTCYEMKIPSAHNVIVDSLHSGSASTRNRAKSLLRANPRNYIPHLMNNLMSPDTDFVIQALNMLGEIGDPLAVRPIKKVLRHSPKDPNIRFAAYEALGFLSIDKGLFTIINGLSDIDASVRVAAARALNANHNKVVLKGIKNLIEDDAHECAIICEAFINAFADDMVTSLYQYETFQSQAEQYLLQEAHPDTRDYYAALFLKVGQKNWANALDPAEKEPSQSELKVVVVDDSKMILNIFRQTLHKLDIDAKVFEFPQEALIYIVQEQPDVVFTDLNMPLMTGVELTRSIREKYSSEELPIIMVTTQSEGDDHERAENAGVNMILNKPFTVEQIDQAIKSVRQK
ncbi:MAG: response regulator [Candidatus Marinimicrobia bacterium]|nr:response regulator [Candidatus Neomarinimicrobiota bacterium]